MLKMVEESNVVPLEPNSEDSNASEDDCSSYADLNRLYSDLYNFTMCEFCFMPASSTYCSEECRVADSTSADSDNS
jgi:hypothetical protein